VRREANEKHRGQKYARYFYQLEMIPYANVTFRIVFKENSFGENHVLVTYFGQSTKIPWVHLLACESRMRIPKTLALRQL